MEEKLNLMTVEVLLSVILGGLLLLVMHVYNEMWLKPQKLRSKLQKQGIRGPSPSFFLGNIPQIKAIKELDQANNKEAASISHDWIPNLFPYLVKWQQEYGPMFVYSVGTIQHVCVADIEMVKEMNSCTSFNLGKPSYLTKDRGPLLGHGIVSSNGPIWVYQRKIISRELYMDKVKGMVNLMVDSTNAMLESWESRIDDKVGVADIKVDDNLRSLSADIISRACFGSNYLSGKEIFSKIRSLQKYLSMTSFGVPGSRHSPSKINREIWKLEREIHSAILAVVKQRMESGQENDLLQMIINGADNCSDMPISRDKFIVDNLKTLYFAGHETSSITASWCLVLLAMHPDWQTRVRAEVTDICKGSFPDVDMLRSMKLLTMVIQETLRLYPPAIFVVRSALEDIEFKGITIPKGMDIQILIGLIQKSPDIWGPDVHEFNPERFSQGVLSASKIASAQAYMPFGVGPRICAGQQFAMIELKITLCLILSKFMFSLSPSYKHSPAYRMVIEPGDGKEKSFGEILEPNLLGLFY
ncbi:hypothetical protein ACFE04_019069 [Oxalis oulophora]